MSVLANGMCRFDGNGIVCGGVIPPAIYMYLIKRLAA